MRGWLLVVMAGCAPASSGRTYPGTLGTREGTRFAVVRVDHHKPGVEVPVVDEEAGRVLLEGDLATLVVTIADERFVPVLAVETFLPAGERSGMTLAPGLEVSAGLVRHEESMLTAEGQLPDGALGRFYTASAAPWSGPVDARLHVAELLDAPGGRPFAWLGSDRIPVLRLAEEDGCWLVRVYGHFARVDGWAAASDVSEEPESTYANEGSVTFGGSYLAIPNDTPEVCVREGTKLRDAPDGEVIGVTTTQARFAVADERAGWHQILIGTRIGTVTAWALTGCD